MENPKLQLKQKKFLHIDMDAFYASVEQNLAPELKGKPVAIGGSMRGVVSAASYEARVFGIHSAMPVSQAKRLCPELILLPVRMGLYKEISKKIMACLESFSPIIEQVSVDEAYLDMTGTERLWPEDINLINEIKRRVHEVSGLTCSIGIAPLKFLAKIASDQNKPNGFCIIKNEDVSSFLSQLPVKKIPGVGPKTKEKLDRFGIIFATDLLKQSEEFWFKHLGQPGVALYKKAQGNATGCVNPSRDAHSFGAENTLPDDTGDIEVLETWLLHQSERVASELRKHKLYCKTISLKLKYSDFFTIQRNKSLKDATCSGKIIFETAIELFRSIKLEKKVRLIGVSGSNLTDVPAQPGLFEDKTGCDKKLDLTLDQIKEKFGNGSIVKARIKDFVKPAKK